MKLKCKACYVLIALVVMNGVLVFFNIQKLIASRDIESRLGIGRNEATLPELEKRLIDLENHYLAKSGRMGHGEGTAGLHAALTFALEDLDVQDQELMVGLGERGEEYGVVPIRLSCKIEYNDLLTLLSNLSQSDRLINVENLSIEKKQLDEERWLSVVIDLRAYYTFNAESDRGGHGLV